MGFRSLRHFKDRRSTSRGPCQARYVPPAGFGYPLGGLLPPSPCRPCFVPAAPLGFSPSELPPLARYPEHSCPNGPTCRFASRFARWLGQRAGPAGRGFWALTLASVPGGRRWFMAPTAGCSLGVHPSKASIRKPGSGFRPISSHALLPPRPETRRPAPQSIDQLPDSSAPPATASRTVRARLPS
jgi:hypothetical protein